MTGLRYCSDLEVRRTVVAKVEQNRTLDRVRALRPLISGAAAEQEREGRLNREVVEAMRDAGVYRMAVPRRFGGNELSPREILAVAEELSAMDGSTGWVGTLAAGNAAIMMPRASKEALERVFDSGPDPVIVGGAVPMARARQVDGGWAFESTYLFASGCLHADWLMVGAIVWDGDSPRMGERGPVTVAGIMPVGTVPIIGSWDTLGLRSTGSLDLDLTGLVLPEAMTFMGIPSFRPLDPLLYRHSYGYFGIMPPISLGIARGALDAFIEAAADKRLAPIRNALLRDTEIAQELVARCRGRLDAARAHLIWAWENVLASADEAGIAPDDTRAAYHIAIVQTVDAAVEVVDDLHRALGTNVIHEGNPIERALRDIHTAAQHIVVSPQRYIASGRVLLGLEPGTTMF
jgi:alkylation response protein AidB-like acyl-CoA dehydrogenase